jgi:hypothetical protein
MYSVMIYLLKCAKNTGFNKIKTENLELISCLIYSFFYNFIQYHYFSFHHTAFYNTEKSNTLSISHTYNAQLVPSIENV